MPPRTSPLPSRPALLTQRLPWSNWYLTMPKLAVGLLVALLAALLWLLQESESEEERSALIADVLWLEQSFHFHLEGTLLHAQQLALDLGSDKAIGDDAPEDVFAARARHLVRTNPELTHIAWLNADGSAHTAQPGPDGPARQGALDVKNGSLAFDMARRLGKPAFSRHFSSGGLTFFELYVPIYRHGGFTGMLVLSHSLPALVGELVPWWFVEKYRMQVSDGDGNVLASKSKVEAGTTGYSHQVLLDPPGHGITLHVAANRGAAKTAQRLIIGLIVFLAGIVFWSLFAIRRQMQQRLFAEEALCREHAFRKAMEDSLTVGMRARDRSGRITYVNPAFCAMTGFREDELLGATPPYPYWNPDEIEEAHALHAKVLDGQAPRNGFEIRFRRKDGRAFDALVYEAPLIEADARHSGWMASIVDVTERKAAEELARQQQEKLQATSRLVTMGEMASTLAHELNQPLAAIASYSAGCLARLDDADAAPEGIRNGLEKLQRQAARAGHIIRRVHDFVKKREPRFAGCDPAEIIDEAIGFIEHFARKRGVRIERHIPGGRPLLLADQVMLEQVLLNLMRNGIEAMSETPPARRSLCVSLSLGDEALTISVRDSGCGLADGVREQLFTPFFSTRPEGMGMGLNICRSIIEFHGGRLWFEAAADGGSVFSLALPLAAAGSRV